MKLALLTGAWIAVTGSPTLPNIVVGLLLGATSLYLVRQEFGQTGGRRHRPLRILALALLFLRELIL